VKLNFRQGIVQYQAPTFLSVSGGYVSIIVVDTPVLFTITDGSVDYLFKEQNSINNAWGPITVGINQWLYWDIDRVSARRTFGITKKQPIVSATQPATPTTDQHWYDTVANKMKVWTGATWSERLRVFACQLSNGSVPVSMSINSPSSFEGTQIGLDNIDTFAGEVLFDTTTNTPFRKSDGTFLTSEAVLTTSASTSNIKAATILVPAAAVTPMAAYTVVKFTDFDQINHADQFTAGIQQFGIVEVPVITGQTVNVVTSGVVSNSLWNWPAINAHVYADAAGVLTTSIPIADAVPVGTVISKTSIIMGSPSVTVNSTGGSGSSNPATAVSLGIVRMSVAPANPAAPIAVGTNDSRVVNAVQTTGSTMTGALVLNADPTSPLQAATKQYVDAAAGGLTFPLSAPNGTVSSPPYSFASSASTGLYLDTASSANTLAVTSNGTKIAKFDTGVSYSLSSDYVRTTNGQFTTTNDSTNLNTVLRAITNNNTVTQMFLNGSATHLALADNCTWKFKVEVIARRTDSTGEHASITVEGAIARDVGAGTTTLIGSLLKTIVARTTVSWDVVVTADNVNGALNISVQGDNGKTIRWVAYVSLVQVLF
jgi:hypothetical protein